MRQHFLPCRDDFSDDLARHAVPGDVQRGLDHRQDKALDAETILPEVSPLGVQKALGKVIRRGVVREKRVETVLRQAEESLVVPERIVGIETSLT
jgi:hypothetical protein